MTKDVLVAVEGFHVGADPTGDSIEVITPGSYYKKKNHQYVVYDEVMEGSDGITKNIIKFNDEMLSLSKSGFVNVDMVFEENKRNVTNYVTPYGALLVGVDAKKINIDCAEDNIKINIDYTLDVNYEHLADCQIKVNIMSKDEKGAILCE